MPAPIPLAKARGSLRLGLLSVGLFIASFLLLYWIDLQIAAQSTVLLATLNTLFSASVSLSIFYLARHLAHEKAERQQTQQALKTSEEQLRLAVQAVRIATRDWDVSTNDVTWNDEHYRMLGYEPGSVVPGYDIWLERVHPDDLALVRKSIEEISCSLPEFSFEFRVVWPDGSIHWLETRGRMLFDEDNRLHHMCSVMLDITKHKEAEEALRIARDELEQRVKERTLELSEMINTLQAEVERRTKAEQVLREKSEQLRAVTTELTLAEQRERQRLAQILHDGLQQVLVAANLRLGSLARGKRSVEDDAHEISALLQEAISISRSLTAELSPPILHDGGLTSGLYWLARWMDSQYALEVRLKVDTADLPPEDLTILLFQAVRELLFNAVKHAQVSTATVHVCSQDDLLQIHVIDDGVGFDPAELRIEGGQSRGFGLFSIRERLQILGGHMLICSAPGQGSHFTICAPVRKKKNNWAAAANEQDLAATPT